MPRPSSARSNGARPTVEPTAFTERQHQRRTYGGETFAQRLKRLRRAAGMSQREVAQQCERVSYAYISRLEAGARLASVRAVRELAAALGVTAAYLEYGREGDDEKAQLLRRIDKQADELRAVRQALAVAESRASRYALQLRAYEREGTGSR